MEAPVIRRDYLPRKGFDRRPRKCAYCGEAWIGVSQETFNPTLLHRLGELLL